MVQECLQPDMQYLLRNRISSHHSQRPMSSTVSVRHPMRNLGQLHRRHLRILLSSLLKAVIVAYLK